MTPEDIFVLPFSRWVLDRAAHHRRDEAWLSARAVDPTTRILVLHDLFHIPVTPDDAIGWRTPAEADFAGERFFLGLDGDGRALFAIDNPAIEADGVEPATAETDVARVNLREIGHLLDPMEASAAVEAVALATWHRHHRFCANCGEPTEIIDAGHVRRCPSCLTSHFPRTDPAVIMLVSDGDRCVLGRRPGSATTRWSTLAGFVEPGESPEAAVVREVAEEVGIVVDRVRYRGAQPWPFPSSLMLAYEAHSDGGELSINEEHLDVRWFTRKEIVAAMESGEMTVPGPISAGGYLLRSWLGRDGD